MDNNANAKGGKEVRISISAEKLMHALLTVYRAVPPRTPLPILTGILFETKENMLYLTATDMEQSIRTFAPATVEEPGSAVLPAREITELVRRLHEVSIVKIETDGQTNTTVISYAQSDLTLHGFSPDEYPSMPETPRDTLVTLPQKLLRKMLKQVLYAVSTEEHRPVFTGVLFEFTNDNLNLVATDTHRLAMRTTPLEKQPNQLINVIVPGKTLNEMSKLLVQEDSDVSIYINENQIFFILNDIQIVTRLLAGKFPNYNLVIPQNTSCDVTVNTKELLEAVDRALLLSTPRRQTVFLQMQDNTMTVFFNAETGRIREDLQVEINGDQLDIGFNGKYLTDALKTVDSETVTFQFTGSNTPALIKPVGQSDYISVLVPAIPQKNN